jgi:hypothetical protein
MRLQFQGLFERKLTQLRHEAFLSLRQAEQAVPHPRPKPFIDPPELESKNAELRGRARAMVVARAFEEIKHLRYDLDHGRTLEELEREYPDFIVFTEKRLFHGKNKLVVADDIRDKKYMDAAWDFAAARVCRAKGTIAHAWTKYHNDLPPVDLF